MTLLFPLLAPPTAPIPPLIPGRPLPSPFTETPTIMAEEEEEEDGEDAVEDTEEEAFADIIIGVVVATAGRFFSEPMEELESASMHSDASSGSDPDPQPEEEEEEEQENEEEEGGQTEELVEEGLPGLSALPSTKTLPQLLLLSLLQGEPEDQGEGSYCESKPGCSKPGEGVGGWGVTGQTVRNTERSQK